ncbi:iron ABC transporter permease [Beijerinckia sp. L45]|uniref:FecCD family ABC transporter permease n=1 Tax=Beijerinckia sp. L45 TaxID=1641855 RepID=UPI001AEE7E2A|nr:iron ABC transporter permease [Beijerinckia sp. L45]
MTRRVFGEHAPVLVLSAILLLLGLLSLGIGRYMIDPRTVFHVLIQHLMDLPSVGSPTEQAIVLNIRPPRIFAAIVVGAALSASGAAYQTMFRNPLVSPEILGVAAGAGFGASIGILLGVGVGLLEILSFGCGLLAALLALAIGRLVGNGSLSILVLGGIVIGAMFGALIAATQYFANPETTLPEITFWLFGSLGRATFASLQVPALIVALCLAALYAVRWPLTVLAAGDDEARTMGINLGLTWSVVIAASTLMTATVVSLAGIIGWVGLVVPHLARFIVGPSFTRLLPASILIGAIYLLAVDDVARSASPLDLPLGILTALVGAPFFILLLMKLGRRWS